MSDPTGYDSAGPSHARTIVFLHGMRVTRRMWQPQMQILAHRYRVIAADLPGHGALREIHFTLPAATKRIADLIDREAGGRALVVGLSLGGYIAMEFASQFPEKAAGLVIASATVEPCGWHAFPYRVFAAVMERAPEKLLLWVSRRFFAAVYPGERAKPLTEPGFFMRGGSEGLREVLGQKFCPRMARYPGAVLFLNGAYDLGFRMQERKFLAAARHGRLEILPKAFHLSNIDQPGPFSEAVLRFADSLEW